MSYIELQGLCNTLKSRVKGLQSELVIKQEEINNVQRTMKYTKVQDLEGLLVEANKEIERLNQMIES